ncbi:hypothetical protein I9054_012370 [Acinetobacter bereziniae]|uniref:Uncharacterized protein n=1 Tax=Acinetobacter bereziniae TaxID=106648 RepID=A0A8I1ABX1_ACIBZ|nr:hypothetical protein [Acinetobacter bereziniae]QQC83027.1 hypothetical protein I9190_11950 [Acinetobacter bereziniae]UUN96178.1 hypothetical protein I9054_012370 [Acinetobacter bereziniae]
MKTMRITSDEERMVMQHRQSIKHEKATVRFRKEIFELAYQFNKYLDEIGESPSFSGYINFFNPPHSGENKIKYEAVVKVINTVNSIQMRKANIT